MHQIPCVAMNLVSPLKLEGDMVNIFKARPPTGWNGVLFSPVCFSISVFPSSLLSPSPVFQTSVLLKTNQKLHFTNVPLSRLWGGCGDNEGLQRSETDMVKWIIRTESFCNANDIPQEIGSLSSIWNRCAEYLYNFPRPIQSFYYNFSFHYDQVRLNSRCGPYLCFREMSECRYFNYLCNYLWIYFA